MKATREVPLTRGLVALVDEADYDLAMSRAPWHVCRGRATFYAIRRVRTPEGLGHQISLHGFLTGWPLVDHINGEGLDNRRANLRPATRTENRRNGRGWGANEFKGVYFQKTGNWAKYRARIRANGRTLHLGVFDTPEEAAHAYDAAAVHYYGEFARPNFPRAS